MENTIRTAVVKSAPYCHNMIVNWIMSSLTSNTGKYLIVGIVNPVFTFTNNDHMDFTAIVRCAIAPDYEEEITLKVKWSKRKNKLTRKFKE